jgi:hypothetical protein
MLEGIYKLPFRHVRSLSSFRGGELDIAAAGNVLGRRFDSHDRLSMRATGDLEHSRTMY